MAAKQEFASRFAKHKDELEWLFMELYRVPGRGKSGRSGRRVSHPGGGTSVWLADVELEPYQALLVRR